MNNIVWTEIAKDINGNSRYVCCHVYLLTRKEIDTPSGAGRDYNLAIARAKKIGGKKYHTKRYGGGIVFQTTNPAELEPLIAEIRGEPFAPVNPLDVLKTAELTEAQELLIGETLVKMFGLKPLRQFEPVRYELRDGYGTKTAIGVARTVIGEMIKTLGG